jgi:hypothetical protein
MARFGIDVACIEPDEWAHASPVQTSVGEFGRVLNKIAGFRLFVVAYLSRVDQLNHPDVVVAISDCPCQAVAAAVLAAMGIDEKPAIADSPAHVGLADLLKAQYREPPEYAEFVRSTRAFQPTSTSPKKRGRSRTLLRRGGAVLSALARGMQERGGG